MKIFIKPQGQNFVATVEGWKPNHFPEPVTFAIEFTRRPHYCDRGRWLVHNHAPTLDYADRWPRYYFDLDVAVREVEAWLDARQELQSAAANKA